MKTLVIVIVAAAAVGGAFYLGYIKETDAADTAYAKEIIQGQKGQLNDSATIYK